MPESPQKVSRETSGPRKLGRPQKWEKEMPIALRLVSEGTPIKRAAELAGVPEATIRSRLKGAA